jgi:hypothetical protein
MNSGKAQGKYIIDAHSPPWVKVEVWQVNAVNATAMGLAEEGWRGALLTARDAHWEPAGQCLVQGRMRWAVSCCAML